MRFFLSRKDSVARSFFVILMLLLSIGGVQAAGFDATVHSQVSIPAGQSEGIILSLRADGDSGFRIQTSLSPSLEMSGWSAQVPFEYVSLRSGETRNCPILVGTPAESGLSAEVYLTITELSTGFTREQKVYITTTIDNSEESFTDQDTVSVGPSGTVLPSDGNLTIQASDFDVLQEFGSHAIAGVHWEVTDWPLGYPYSEDPVVYANQTILINAAIKNIDNEEHTYNYKLRISKKGLLGFSEVAELNTGELIISSNETRTITATWNTSTEVVGEYRFELTSG